MRIKILMLLTIFMISTFCNIEVRAEKSNNISEGKISNLVLLAQPHKGPRYAHRVAHAIISAAHKVKLNNTDLQSKFPEMIAATASIESDYSMASRPCVGIMQLNVRVHTQEYRKLGLDPYNLEDNVLLGAMELATHYNHSSRGNILSSRSGSYDRLAYMWGRYNGSGSHGSYAHKALKVYHKIHENKMETIKPPSRKHKKHKIK